MAETLTPPVNSNTSNMCIEARNQSACHKDKSDEIIAEMLAREVDKLSSELVLTMPYQKPKRIGDTLVKLLLILIRAARKLGIKVFKWFDRVNKQQFCNVIIMWATITQKQLLYQSRGPSRFQPNFKMQGGPDPRNLALIYHTIDYIGTFDSWQLDDLVKTLNTILSSSQQSQSILRYMTSAAPHIHGGSWMFMTKSRVALRNNRTFSEVQRSMNLKPERMDEVVREYATKAALDLFQTENAAQYRILLNSMDRRNFVAMCLPYQFGPRAMRYDEVNLNYLPNVKRMQVVGKTQPLWDPNIIPKLQSWMDHGVEPIEIARGLYYFSNIGMYPSRAVVNSFLKAASKTKAGIDGDLEIGQMKQHVGPTRRRVSVTVLEYFLLEGISANNLYILGPTLSRENNELVQQKFNRLWKLGYQNKKWKYYRSLLRYGFKINVDQLRIKNQVKTSLKDFISRKHPRDMKSRATYLYYHLKVVCNISDLPINTIFEYDGSTEYIVAARMRLEYKRVKAAEKKQYRRWWKNRKHKRKLELGEDPVEQKKQRTACVRSTSGLQSTVIDQVMFELRTPNVQWDEKENLSPLRVGQFATSNQVGPLSAFAEKVSFMQSNSHLALSTLDSSLQGG